MSGELLPYLMRNDSMITVLLFGCLMLVAYVVSAGRGRLERQLKSIFSNRERASLFDDVTTEDARYTALLILHSCVLMGLCIYYYWVNTQPELFRLYSHWLLLVGIVGGIGGLVLLKCTAYSLVNWVFFDKASSAVWISFYYNLIAASGFILLPIVLLVVYFDLSFQSFLVQVGFVTFFVKIILFFKCFSNFFNNFHGCLHLILYLCTLEILPDVLLWKCIVQTNLFLLQ